MIKKTSNKDDDWYVNKYDGESDDTVYDDDLLSEYGNVDEVDDIDDLEGY